MKRIAPAFLLVILITARLACQAGSKAAIAPTPVETDACCLNEQPGLVETLAASLPEVTRTPLLELTAVSTEINAASQTETPRLDWEKPHPEVLEPGYLRQGALFGTLDPYGIEDVATGRYRPDFPGCGEPSLAVLPEESGEIVLTLRYATPFVPEQIELFSTGTVEGIRRVELLNSQSGLGREIFTDHPFPRREVTEEGACSVKLILTVDVDFEVDTVYIAFETLTAVSQLGTVEMTGSLEDFVDVPVFWRIALPGTPVDLATGMDGMIYAASESNALDGYDVEGNRLKSFAVQSGGNLIGLATDPFGGLVTFDTGGGFTILSLEGEPVATNREASTSYAAVHSIDGNLYLLEAGGISVYTTDTADFVRKMPLDELHSYTGLAFDPQGRLYTLRDFDWSATLVELDPRSGNELDAIPLERSEQVKVAARDLAIDGYGNFYILFNLNVGQIAVHKLDAQGDLVRQFGLLADSIENRPEGSFFDPRAITVSPDGRFIFIADGHDQSSYLTAFLVELE